jgi:hypothetical protein
MPQSVKYPAGGALLPVARGRNRDGKFEGSDFVAAYEERSFTAAAVREDATQLGVSQHIRKLKKAFA